MFESEEIRKQLIKASQGTIHVVVADETDEVSIWGSSASYSALKMAGGKVFILSSYEIRDSVYYSTNAIIYNDTKYTLDEMVEEIFDYFK